MRHLSYILLIQNNLCTYLCLVLSFVHCVWLVTMDIHYVRWSSEDNPWGVLRIKVECRDGFTPTPTTHTHTVIKLAYFFLFSTFCIIIIMVTNDISVALYHIIMYQWFEYQQPLVMIVYQEIGNMCGTIFKGTTDTWTTALWHGSIPDVSITI